MKSLRKVSLAVTAATLSAVFSGCGGGGGGGLSSRSTRIPFVSTRSGNRQVYLMNTNGANQVRLTASVSGENFDPSLSSDENKVAFSSTRDGNAEIYVMNVDGTNIQRLTNDSGASAPSDTEPVFSPNGQKIAWTSTRGGRASIWIMDTTGANQVQLSTETGANTASSPCWRPDGNAVGYVASRTGFYPVIVKPIGGGADQVYANFATPKSGLHFTPDGNSVLYSQGAPGSTVATLLFINLSTGAPTNGPSVGTRNQDGTLSPDGKTILFASGNSATTLQIYSALVPAGAATQLTTLGSNSAPSWRE
jgi:Tol biopolymer transport system component